MRKVVTAFILLIVTISMVSYAEGKLPIDSQSSEDVKKIKDLGKLKELKKIKVLEKLDEIKKIKDPDKMKNLKKIKVLENDELVAYAQALYTTKDNPFNHLTASGDPYDGVADLTLTLSDGVFGCSGALLPTGKHVLTAAHCVTDEFGNFDLIFPIP